jgi:hypothetical protein
MGIKSAQPQNLRLSVATLIVICIAAGVVAIWQTRSPIKPLIDLASPGCSLVCYVNGFPSRTVHLEPDSTVISLVDTILKNKERVWRPSLYSYAPVILLRGETYSVNFQKSRVVVNFRDTSGHWRQAVSELTSQEIIDLEKAAANCLTGAGSGMQ